MLDTLFPEYHRPSDVGLREIWKSGLFVLDTNVLLDLYRYSEKTRKELLDTLKSLNDRLWLPHQVAKEFCERRFDVMLDQRNVYDNFRRVLQGFPDDLKKELSSKLASRNHPIISVDHIVLSVKETIDTLLKELEAQENAIPSDIQNDSVFPSICGLLNGRIGPPFDEARCQAILKEGDERYKKRIPPGFRDGDKDGDAKFGDLLIWKQMLAQADECKKPVVFITSDTKDDWWWRVKGQTIGPSPLLVKEMHQVAGVPFCLYRTASFLELSKEYLNAVVEDTAICEVREVQSRQSHNATHDMRHGLTAKEIIRRLSVQTPKGVFVPGRSPLEFMKWQTQQRTIFELMKLDSIGALDDEGMALLHSLQPGPSGLQQQEPWIVIPPARPGEKQMEFLRADDFQLIEDQVSPGSYLAMNKDGKFVGGNGSGSVLLLVGNPTAAWRFRSREQFERRCYPQITIEHADSEGTQE